MSMTKKAHGGDAHGRQQATQPEGTLPQNSPLGGGCLWVLLFAVRRGDPPLPTENVRRVQGFLFS